MKPTEPKIYVAAALMIAILVAGLIIITGLSSSASLFTYLVSFLLIYSSACIYIARNILGNKIILASILLFILALSIVFFLSSYRAYQDISGKYNNSAEISLMQSQNDYYMTYANYLNQSIMMYQNQTRAMENQLAELQRLKASQAQQTKQDVFIPSAPQITVPETSYINYSTKGREDGNDD